MGKLMGFKYLWAYKGGPLLTHQQNAIKMAFCWRTDSGPRMYAGCVFIYFFCLKV